MRIDVGKALPLSADRDVWIALTDLYASTEHVRHSLVHRRADFDAITGALVGTADHGSPLKPVTRAEQEAFCRAVQRAASSLIDERFSPRQRDDLVWNLSQVWPGHQA